MGLGDHLSRMLLSYGATKTGSKETTLTEDRKRRIIIAVVIGALVLLLLCGLVAAVLALGLFSTHSDAEFSCPQCENNGTCVRLPDGSIRCVCTPQFTGPNCSQPINCTADMCEVGGTCVDTPTVHCVCPDGYTGDSCPIPDACSSYCANGGTCMFINNQLTCYCVYPYTGPNCDLNGMTTFSYAICANVSCYNGGTCVPKSTTQFFCFCASGWTGYLCDDEIDFCLSNPCVHGTCVSRFNGYTCVCDVGYTGIKCQSDINECAFINPPFCNNNATCINTQGSYACACSRGYRGYNCTQYFGDDFWGSVGFPYGTYFSDWQTIQSSMTIDPCTNFNNRFNIILTRTPPIVVMGFGFAYGYFESYCIGQTFNMISNWKGTPNTQYDMQEISCIPSITIGARRVDNDTRLAINFVNITALLSKPPYLYYTYGDPANSVYNLTVNAGCSGSLTAGGLIDILVITGYYSNQVLYYLEIYHRPNVAADSTPLSFI